MSNLTYWEKRQAQHMFEMMEKTEITADEIAKLYYKASRWIDYEMQDIFERYQGKHKLTETEAYKLLNRLKNKESIQEVKQALASAADLKNNKQILAELESPAYAYRIERLQKIQQEMDLFMQNIYDQEKDFNTKHYINLAFDVYNKTMFDIQKQTGYAFSFSALDAESVERVISSKWSGENYSKRIWHNTKALAGDVKEELLINMLTGRTNQEAADIIANKFAQSASNARRLIRTESCYISNQMEMVSYKECGIETYIFLATLDLKTSLICRELDGQRFLVREQKVGINCPPMHPWCRSTTICNITDEELKQMQRRAYDPETGHTIIVPASMNYKEWYDKYIANNSKALAEEKKIKNKSTDRKQYEEYKIIFGKTFPDSFVKFQEMKYNNTKSWEEFKQTKQEHLNRMKFKDITGLIGILGNKEVRIWYKAQDETIPKLIDRTLSIEQQARQACQMRIDNRINARALMKDVVERKRLEENFPNKTFEELLEHKMNNKGMTREQAIEDILKTATKTNKEVNKALGLE